MGFPLAVSIPGGGILEYIHKHRFITLFWVQNFRKMNIFGYEEIVDIFEGSLQNWTIFWRDGGHFYTF